MIEIEFEARRDDSSVWHILVNGDTVGHIRRTTKGWCRDWNCESIRHYTEKQRTEIVAAAKEKETLLNVIRRLTA